MARAKKKMTTETKKYPPRPSSDLNTENDSSPARTRIPSAGREFNPEVETPHELPDDYETDSRP